MTKYLKRISLGNDSDAIKWLVDQVARLRADLAQALTGDLLLAATVLSIGTSSKKAVKNTAFQYQVDGVRANKALGETAFTATTHDIADGSKAIYVLSIAQGGTITITKGTSVLIAAAASAPATPANEVKLGEALIQASGAIFDATSDDLDAAHLTVTYTPAAAYAATATEDAEFV